MIFSFRIFKADKFPKIRVDFTFLLLIALLFLLRDRKNVRDILLVCGLHEWGHLAAMAVFGVRLRAVHLSGFGIRMITKKSGTEPLLKSIVILLSGPAVNLLLFLLMGRKVPETAMLSLGACLYNLLPFSQLDGGAVLELLISGSVHEYALRMALRLLRMALFALSAVLVYCYGCGLLPLPGAIFALCFSERQSHSP